MKHLLTAIACFFALSMSAQTTVAYNPDSDGDYFVGAEDLLALLSEYGTSFTPLQYTSEAVIVPYVADDWPSFFTNEYSTLYIIDTRISEYNESDVWIYATVEIEPLDENDNELPLLNGTEYWFLIPPNHGLELNMNVEHEDFELSFLKRGSSNDWNWNWGTDGLPYMLKVMYLNGDFVLL